MDRNINVTLHKIGKTEPTQAKASMTINEPTHIMGPEGEIIATIASINDGKGIVLDFEYEKVKVKIHERNGQAEYLTINLEQ